MAQKKKINLSVTKKLPFQTFYVSYESFFLQTLKVINQRRKNTQVRDPISNAKTKQSHK